MLSWRDSFMFCDLVAMFFAALPQSAQGSLNGMPLTLSHQVTQVTQVTRSQGHQVTRPLGSPGQK